ncbi:DMT family transporter [Dongia sp.]|uniref:DMT family transporter n=1 Tax=Dongia sp. TaxID=1977262 RepID=UPI0035AFB54B
MTQDSIKRPGTAALTKVQTGIVIIILTVFAMSFADAVVKFASAAFPLWQIYVLRSLMVLPVLVAIASWQGRAGSMAFHSARWAFLRGMLLALMYIAIYAAAPVLSLPVIAAALYTAPLFIALFSALFVREKVTRRQWAGICLGFIGVLVILRPAAEGFSPLAPIPIVAAMLYALAAIMTRTRCSTETPMALALAVNLSLLAVGLAASAVIYLWQPSPDQAAVYPFLLGHWVAMAAREWGIVALLAVLMVAISLGLAKAYQSAPSSVIATFDYSYLVFAAFWSFVMFSQTPDGATIIGMVMIAAAGLLVIDRS